VIYILINERCPDRVRIVKAKSEKEALKNTGCVGAKFKIGTVQEDMYLLVVTGLVVEVTMFS